MKQLIRNNKSGKLRVEEVPIPALGDGGLLIKNHFSAVSIGTESSSIKTAKMNLLQKAKSRPKELKQVIDLAKSEGPYNAYKIAIGKLEAPSFLGYSCSGEVIDVSEGITNFKVGDKVVSAGAANAFHAEVNFVPENLCVKIPNGVDMEQASFSTIASIALHGVRQSGSELGENVAVIGLGLVGQFTIKFLLAAGCNVVGIDLDDRKVSFTEDNKKVLSLSRKSDGLKEKILAFTDGFGVDKVIIAAAGQTNDPLEFATKILRDRGRITDVGNVLLDVPRREFYDNEFELNMSRSYGPGRYEKNYEDKGLDYPIGYVRWTENRNILSYLKMLEREYIDINDLITHKFSFNDAVSSYEKIMDSDDFILGSTFSYSQNVNLEDTLNISESTNQKLENIRLGLVGAGNYTQRIILPLINKQKDISKIGICTSKGANAMHYGKKFGFAYGSTDYMNIVSDSDINTVFVLTRHDLHSEIVCEALENGKNIFVEKPLAINRNQLENIQKTFSNKTNSLMVGFNRRFSPFIKKAMAFFEGRKNPIFLNMKINAGVTPKEKWQQDPEIGGGRIIGDVCHFIDLSNYIVGKSPHYIYADSISTSRNDLMEEDNSTITIKYSDGSLANISYITSGDSSLPKENIEMSSESKTVKIIDFRKSFFISNGRSKKYNFFSQDKGQKEMFKEFFESLRSGLEPPISFAESYLATKMCFDALDSMRMKKRIEL